jgi:hypothetical protein
LRQNPALSSIVVLCLRRIDTDSGIEEVVYILMAACRQISAELL